ncbi:sigma-70 family RNA polymerase sigma factor [Echinicola soli]|uniref:Sigma-70 family RNA polymerase sigma factor n=1 Tax=Echinicola soli TaxID=2591634 RepID=A0A514CJL6_9BACT|nr:sigma-70 family RNA polymerase sigma factor [Echinicola soli]QDH80017.1 sigma-70 family RNA polymerase sigma factor [Echinicola soli]
MENYRPLLFTYAYNILGAALEAEDVVQDVFEKYLTMDSSTVQNEKAYLIKMVINHAINRKNKLNKTIIAYPHNWLPEPVSTDNSIQDAENEHLLSYSLMILLEKLEVRQRAIFLLKEAFGYSHEEISNTLDISQEVSRQSLSRAKKKLKGATISRPSPKGDTALMEYLSAIQSGDADKLEKLLLDDISLTSDGGGKVPAGTNILYGKERVMAMLQGIYRKFYQEITIHQTVINHTPALLYLTAEGLVINCQVFVFNRGKIAQMYFIRNPDKLTLFKKKPHIPSHNR